MLCSQTSNTNVCLWLVQIQAYLQNQTKEFSLFNSYKENLLGTQISEQSAFCSIFPELGKENHG